MSCVTDVYIVKRSYFILFLDIIENVEIVSSVFYGWNFTVFRNGFCSPLVFVGLFWPLDFLLPLKQRPRAKAYPYLNSFSLNYHVFLWIIIPHSLIMVVNGLQGLRELKGLCIKWVNRSSAFDKMLFGLALWYILCWIICLLLNLWRQGEMINLVTF